MKKGLWLISILALLMIAGSKPSDPIRFTIINKSEMDIAIQLQAKPQVCCNVSDTDRGEFYYLPVAEGSRQAPSTKTFIIERNTYQMQMFFLETWDPVYGLKCDGALPNVLIARNNLRLVVLPCNQLPAPCAVGERTMWKYIPFAVPEYSIFYSIYWRTRLIY